MAYNNRKPRFNRRNDEVPKGAGLYVEVRNNDVEKALRRLKNMINNDGLMKTLKQKSITKSLQRLSNVKKQKQKNVGRRNLKS